MYNVLIVEDDPMVAMINEQYVCRNKSFTVVKSCRNGQEALDFLEGNSDEKTGPKIETISPRRSVTMRMMSPMLSPGQMIVALIIGSWISSMRVTSGSLTGLSTSIVAPSLVITL